MTLKELLQIACAIAIPYNNAHFNVNLIDLSNS